MRDKSGRLKSPFAAPTTNQTKHAGFAPQSGAGAGHGRGKDLFGASGMIAARLPDPGFWAGKSVLVTGHTGFKGGWLTLWLSALGANVTGLALSPETKPSLFELADIGSSCRSEIADLRDASAVKRVVRAARPEIVLHLAAQALVRRSYREPGATFATNAQGTANLLDALADAPDLKAILAITSDKVYANDESGRAFREDDALGGHDPYSLSKAAAEHVVAGFRAAIFEKKGIALATARGGNVIGGGDYSEDRIVPDIVRAAASGVPLVLRNPSATRPWQHVLDCLCGYLVFAERLAGGEGAPMLSISGRTRQTSSRSPILPRRCCPVWVRIRPGSAIRHQLARRARCIRSRLIRQRHAGSAFGTACPAASLSTGPPNGIARRRRARMPGI